MPTNRTNNRRRAEEQAAARARAEAQQAARVRLDATDDAELSDIINKIGNIGVSSRPTSPEASSPVVQFTNQLPNDAIEIGSNIVRPISLSSISTSSTSPVSTLSASNKKRGRDSSNN